MLTVTYYDPRYHDIEDREAYTTEEPDGDCKKTAIAVAARHSPGMETTVKVVNTYGQIIRYLIIPVTAYAAVEKSVTSPIRTKPADSEITP